MKTKYRQYEISKDRVEFVNELKDALSEFYGLTDQEIAVVEASH